MSTKVIVSATNKGGEGKTKLSILMSEYFSGIKGLKGLGIDLDPQSNFSSRFLKMEIDPNAEQGKMPPQFPDYDPNDPDENHDLEGRSSIADIFYGDEIYPYSTHLPGFEIAPAYSSKLLDAEAVTKQEVAEKIHKQLKLFVNLDGLKQYDYIVIDTPPAKGPLTISAFKAATHLLMPTQLEQFSVDGIYGMLQLWKQESYSRDSDVPINLVGILPNRFRDINLHKDFYHELMTTPIIKEHILPCCLKQRVVYAEVDVESASPRTIFDYPQKNEGRKEATEVCKEIYKRIFNND